MLHRTEENDLRDGVDSIIAASLVHELVSPGERIRRNARESLVQLGSPAVDPLLEALRDDRKQMRWEAAKALCDIASPRSAGALVDALEDEDGDVRWVAAEALIAMRKNAIKPLLHALQERKNTPELREGAHHVLHDLNRGDLAAYCQPVLDALDGPAPDMRTPLAAHEVLEREAAL
ncbi:MAG TPA: HEAT repeat domain-containing protein [Phycisphaerae bacterium]|nr:HEAT repeat domain-containing protein [Phycisphaerales bacterium]HRX85887.1 HEAT repeat domain-containing protein [Phycisphaerae bacterium]